ncbi:hypothetical protein DBB36_10485 [Flavobacterium sp. WLB]|nr:hypothetical protein DBB36_10485 [Flavobacterium sp. WLB]
MNFQKTWIICCFFNFLIACTFGLLMRFMFLFHLNFINYSFILHVHSHVAMLGWVYMIIYVLVIHFFIPKEKSRKPVYNRLFWLTELSVTGMMLAFPFQGYGLFSIAFSTMHILLSYLFCRLIWKDLPKQKTSSQRLLSVSVLFMVFSTLGVWCLGPAVSTLGKQSAFYQIAIQFFLHFQFNGWFLLAVLALFLKQFHHKIDETDFRKFYIILIVSTILTVSFPIRWFVESNVLRWINTFGVVLQLTAFIYFYKMLRPQISDFKANLNKEAKKFYGLALCSLFLKIGIQLLIIFPNIATISHKVRNFVIGFIHLSSLGIITGFVFGILLQNKMLSSDSLSLKMGVKCFIFGYVGTEVLLFLQGGFFLFNKGTILGYYQNIFGFSLLLVLGLILITASAINKKQESIHS